MAALPRSAWDRERIDGFVEPGGADTVVAPDTGALQALGIMSRAGRPRLLVVEASRLLGMVSQRDLLDYCSAAMELEARPGATSARSTSP
jgi:CBS domain-containing protein